MGVVTVLFGICAFLTYVLGLPSLDEGKRILQFEANFVSNRMLDIQTRISPTPAQRGNKRKRDDDLNNWMVEGGKLVNKARLLINHIGSCWCNLLGVKVRWEVSKLLKCLKVHGTKGEQLLAKALSDARGPCHGYHIPVKQIIGQVAYEALDHLKRLLVDDKIGRIAIHGERGTGKTFVMKHLHNWARNRFDHVFWVPSPADFTVESVQNAVAEVVLCDFASNDALSVRAAKLSDALFELGSVAIFLDGAPEANFSLDQVGIPTPESPDEGFRCKLVLSTSSTMECTMLHSFNAIEIRNFTDEDALKFFLHTANIGEGSVTSLDDIPRSLANSCDGVPRRIEKIATCMRGIDDPREWRNAEVELGP